MGSFGPLAWRGNMNTSQTVFFESWQAQGTSAGGTRLALGDYNILPPSGGKAFFHFLLDASGSTWDRCTTGEKKRVYEHLLDYFANLVQHNPEVVRPSDEISVWLFNKETRLLCQVEQKEFHKKVDYIRKQYRHELDITNNYRETRLYDAMGTVMEKIRETWKQNKKSDFFLVPFTDGQDNTSLISIDEMMRKVTSLPARLHTFFITVNLPSSCALYKRLEHQHEMSLIQLENTEPREISRGFVVLRDLIKAILVVVIHEQDELKMTRIVDYGLSKQEVAERMMAALAVKMRDSSLLDGWNSLHTLPWRQGP